MSLCFLQWRSEINTMKVWGWGKTNAGSNKKESDHSCVGSWQEGRSKYEASVSFAVEAKHPPPPAVEWDGPPGGVPGYQGFLMRPRGPGISNYICSRSKHSGTPGAKVGVGIGTVIIWGHWPESPKGRPGLCILEKTTYFI